MPSQKLRVACTSTQVQCTAVPGSSTLPAVVAVVQIFAIILATRLYIIHVSSSEHFQYPSLFCSWLCFVPVFHHLWWLPEDTFFSVLIIRSLTRFLVTSPAPRAVCMLDHIYKVTPVTGQDCVLEVTEMRESSVLFVSQPGGAVSVLIQGRAGSNPIAMHTC